MNSPLHVPDRVLMTADTVGGVWTFALELSRALQPWDVDVALATMGAPPSDEQRRAVAALDHVTLYPSDYRLEWMDDPWDDVEAAGEWLKGLEARVQPDLVHLNNYAHGALSWQSPVLMVGHSCVVTWFASVKGTPPTEDWDRYRRVVMQGLQGADRVTAPTMAMLRALTWHYGPFPRDGAVYNGRRPDPFQPKEKEPFVLSAGRLWDPAKNAAALQEAAPNLPWPVYLAGSTEHPDGGRVSCEPVTCLGRLSTPALADWMGRASIYALPARYEPFGLTPLEAGLSGCALVLGDLPTLREVWRDAALYVPPNDTEALGATLTRLIEDDDLRRHYASRARRRAQTYTLSRMAKGYLACYDALLPTPTPALEGELVSEQ